MDVPRTTAPTVFPETKKAGVTKDDIDNHLANKDWKFNPCPILVNPMVLPTAQQTEKVIARYILHGSNGFLTRSQMDDIITCIQFGSFKKGERVIPAYIKNLAQWNYKSQHDYVCVPSHQNGANAPDLYRKKGERRGDLPVVPLEDFYNLLLAAHLGPNNTHLCRDASYRKMSKEFTKSIPKDLVMDFIKECPNPTCRSNVTKAQNSRAQYTSKVEAGEVERRQRKNAKRPRDDANADYKPAKRSRNPRGYESTHSPMSRMYLAMWLTNCLVLLSLLNCSSLMLVLRANQVCQGKQLGKWPKA